MGTGLNTLASGITTQFNSLISGDFGQIVVFVLGVILLFVAVGLVRRAIGAR